MKQPVPALYVRNRAAGFRESQFHVLETYASGITFVDERPTELAFPEGPELAPITGAMPAPPPKVGKRPEAPPPELEKLMGGLSVPKGLSSHEPPYRVGGEGFFPMWGGEDWLDSYEEEEWPDFDKGRYFAIGTNGGSDYWLYDLDAGQVVSFSHERGYDETNFTVVGKDPVVFARSIEATKR